MKKVWTVLLGTSLLACLLLTACGGDSSSASTGASSAGSSSAPAASSSSAASSEDNSDKNFAQELLDEAKSELEDAKAQVDAKGDFVMEVLARDKNTIVYRYQLASDEIQMDVAAQEKLLESQADNFMAGVEELAQRGATDAKIIIEYVDTEGKELLSKTYQK